MGAATGVGNRAASLTLDRSQGPAVGLLVSGTQLLPVQGGPRRQDGGRLGQGSQGIDIEIAVMGVLLAEIIAGWNFGFAFRENLLELTNDLFQFLPGKLFAKPQHKSCYFAQGGGSPWNLTGSFDSPQRKETSPPLPFPVKWNPSLLPGLPLWKLPRHGNGGKIKRPFSRLSHNAWKTLRRRHSEFPTVPTASATSPIHSLSLQNCRVLGCNQQSRFICNGTGTPTGEDPSLLDSQSKLKGLAA